MNKLVLQRSKVIDQWEAGGASYENSRGGLIEWQG